MTDLDSTSKELLTFKLGNQEYALDIMSVREIRGWTKTTPMPHAPAFMRGVINLRGTVLPVIDLAARLGLPPTETTERNVIIVVKCNDCMTGLLVDAVSDIIALSADDMQPPPDVTNDGGANTIRALSLIDERMIRILELESVIAKAESVAA
ncbi:chemotaxis protein CheW [Aliishimia ponticola]|uniref:Chemotaxis protein CheW n=1 Tax=Aliishimia ponticola TaxID=2499833 RepID=A0A4S4NFU6_9RHOB|nr:chemotaxis protein CheW [Aliishimia ponticola]THH38474.1 chemotaxis protein CheW [Aliishimia ponticola]